MGLPSATRDFGIRHDNTTGECRDAALYVAATLAGDTPLDDPAIAAVIEDCRHVLSALGLISYEGHDIRTGHQIRVWRQGAVTQ